MKISGHQSLESLFHLTGISRWLARMCKKNRMLKIRSGFNLDLKNIYFQFGVSNTVGHPSQTQLLGTKCKGIWALLV